MASRSFPTDRKAKLFLWNPKTREYEPATQEEVDGTIHERSWAEVGLTHFSQDPLYTALFFAHLRSVLGGCDINHIEVEMSLTFSGLNEHQLAALNDLSQQSWSYKSTGVHTYRAYFKRHEHAMAEREAENEDAAARRAP